MRTSADPVLVKRLSVFASAASVFSVAIGLSVLAGRTVHFKTLLTWGFGTAMAPNAAACTVLGGMSCGCCESRTTPLHRGSGSLPLKSQRPLSVWRGCSPWQSGSSTWSWYRPAIDRRAHAAQRRCTRPHVPDCRRKFPTIWSRSADDRLAHPARGLACPVPLSWAATAPAFGLLGLLLGPKVSDLTVALPAVVSYFLLTSGLVCSRASWALGGLLTSRSRERSCCGEQLPQLCWC